MRCQAPARRSIPPLTFHILQWWERAYLEDERTSQVFYIEAEAALPLMNAESRDLDGVLHAMQHQRAKLKASQQLGEWGSLLKPGPLTTPIKGPDPLVL